MTRSGTLPDLRDMEDRLLVLSLIVPQPCDRCDSPATLEHQGDMLCEGCAEAASNTPDAPGLSGTCALSPDGEIR